MQGLINQVPEQIVEEVIRVEIDIVQSSEIPLISNDAVGISPDSLNVQRESDPVPIVVPCRETQVNE